MSGGVVTGGWEFVWAAYAITGSAFLVYAATVIVRLRAERERARREAAEGGGP